MRKHPFLLCSFIVGAISVAGSVSAFGGIRTDRIGIESSSQAAPVWVFLSDKGAHDAAEIDALLRDLERTYNPRAIERRRQRRSAPCANLFDIRDLPIAQHYVDEIAQNAVRVRTRSRWLNAVSVLATKEQVDALRALPFVRAIQPVRNAEEIDLRDVRAVGEGRGQHGLNPNGGFYGIGFDQLQTINLPAVHDLGWTGEGLIIGVLDTGFQRTHSAFHHPDNPLEVIAEYDFINDDPNTAPEQGDHPDQHWHGTIILGTMGAYAPGTFVGAAYDAAFILCKTEDITDEYQGEEDFYVAGLEFIEANGGDVATSSLIYYDWYTQQDMDGQTAVTTIAVNIATQNGVYCCTAVGNAGHDQDPETSRLGAPADAFQVFSVGSVNIFGEESGFSADGPTVDGRVKPEILTVGEVAYSINPFDDNGYLEASGTSMATPMMAGAVACVSQSNASVSVDAMRDAFMLTASDYVQNGTYDLNYVRGYGIVDALAALDAAGGPSLATLDGVTITTGTLLAGGLGELGASDDQYVRTRSGFGSTLVDLHHMRARIDATTAVESPTTLEIAIESRIDQPSGTAQVRLRNHGSGQEDLIRQYALGQTESTEVVSGVNASNYVGVGGEIELSVKHIVFVPFLAFTFESFLDLVEIRVE